MTPVQRWLLRRTRDYTGMTAFIGFAFYRWIGLPGVGCAAATWVIAEAQMFVWVAWNLTASIPAASDRGPAKVAA